MRIGVNLFRTYETAVKKGQRKQGFTLALVSVTKDQRGAVLESFDLILLSSVSLLIAGTIKGLAGLGLPTASAGIMTLWIAPRTAIALILIPMLVSNAWQVLRMGDVLGTIRRYAPLCAALALVLFVTLSLSASAPDRVIFIVLGLSILSFSVVNLLVALPQLPARLDKPAQLIAGAIAGALGGLSGIWAAPMVFYLTASQVDKDEFIRATGLLIFAGSVPLAIGYIQQGFLTQQFALIGAVMIVPTLIGFSIGERIRMGWPSDTFRKVFLYMFLVMGLNLLRRGLF